jgi:anti-sigma B factor antagonist
MAVSLILTPIDIGEVTLIEAAGRIVLGDSGATLRAMIQEHAARGRTKLLLNLADISYIDSSGVGELVSAFTTIARQGGTLKLLNLSKRVQDLLQMTKLYTVFEVYDNKDKALRSFSS